MKFKGFQTGDTVVVNYINSRCAGYILWIKEGQACIELCHKNKIILITISIGDMKGYVRVVQRRKAVKK